MVVGTKGGTLRPAACGTEMSAAVKARSPHALVQVGRFHAEGAGGGQDVLAVFFEGVLQRLPLGRVARVVTRTGASRWRRTAAPAAQIPEPRPGDRMAIRSTTLPRPRALPGQA